MRLRAVDPILMPLPKLAPGIVGRSGMKSASNGSIFITTALSVAPSGIADLDAARAFDGAAGRTDRGRPVRRHVLRPLERRSLTLRIRDGDDEAMIDRRGQRRRSAIRRCRR